MQIIKTKITKIEQLEDFDNEYVYDIGVKGDTPYFFGNDILVHNSCYFTAAKIYKDNEFFKQKFNDFEPTKENYIKVYDTVADEVNDTFPDFMDKSFNTTIEKGKIIKCGRELVASRCLFIKKKKYACLLYEHDGIRLDKNGKAGKLKVLGMDLKRADTISMMQKFLEEILMDILTDGTEDMVINKVKLFRDEFKKLKPHEMGMPRKVNNLTAYNEKMTKDDGKKILDLKVKDKKLMVPNHVRAAGNFNKMVDIHHDTLSQKITDGGKVVVCYLKQNVYGMSSIAYPVDQQQLPDWFLSLPFDTELMTTVSVDKKIINMLSVLGWDLQKTKNDNAFDEFFSF